MIMITTILNDTITLLILITITIILVMIRDADPDILAVERRGKAACQATHGGALSLGGALNALKFQCAQRDCLSELLFERACLISCARGPRDSENALRGFTLRLRASKMGGSSFFGAEDRRTPHRRIPPSSKNPPHLRSDLCIDLPGRRSRIGGWRPRKSLEAIRSLAQKKAPKRSPRGGPCTV